MRVYDAKGNPVSDTVLIKPHSNGEMHPAVAVANVLKLWLAANAAQCLTAMGSVIIQGTISGNALVTNNRRYRLAKDANGVERCDSLTNQNRNIQEPYWILNPGANGNIRYLVTTRRDRLAEKIDLVKKLCRDSRNAAVYGMEIK